MFSHSSKKLRCILLLTFNILHLLCRQFNSMVFIVVMCLLLRKYFSIKKSCFVTSLLLLTTFLIHDTLYASNFKPFTKLYTIKTDKFDIIYSDATRRTAYQLAQIADDTYKKYSEILGIEITYRIPLTITSDIRIHNAYAYPVSYPHIVIYDAPSTSDFSTYKNDIEATFIHELCHIFFLAPNNTIGTKIFGSWFSFVNLSTTYFMTEGISVAMESSDGFGRVNDPLVRQRIRQDIREGKFKSPIQATDAWDLYPYITSSYEYGGLFNQYIIDKFGIEKYREFLHRIQNSFIPSFNYYNAGTYNAFKKVYGISFLEEWAEFEYRYITTNVLVNTNERITKNDTTINAITHNDNKLYYVNNSYSTLIEYDPISKKNKTIKTINKSTSSLNINEDGTKILIGSDMVYTTFATPVIEEYDIENKKYTKLKLKNTTEARYFRNGIVAISSDLNNTYMAFFTDNGTTTEILLPPSRNIVYSYPTVIDDNKIALIYATDGIKQLAIYDYNTQKISIVKSNRKNDEDIWKHIRYLSYSNNKLLFSYNDDDRFYKLAILDLANNKLHLTKIDYSGSVLDPVLVDDGSIYYKGRFSDTEAVMLYPQSIESLESETYNTSLVNTESVDDIVNIVEDYETKYNEGIFNYQEKNYFGIKYMNPLKMWFPIPIYAEGSPYLFTGVGIATMMTDATDNNSIIFSGGIDIVSMFFDFDLMWLNQSLLYPIFINISDKVIYSSDIRYRSTLFALGLSPFFYLNDRTTIVLTPFVAAGLFFMTDIYRIYTSRTESYIWFDYGDTAYSWRYRGYTINTGANMSYQYQNNLQNSINKDLFYFLIAPIYSITKNEYRIDAKLSMQSRYAPIKVSIFGGYSSEEDGISFSNYGGTFGTRNIGGGDEFITFVNSYELQSSWLFGYEIDLMGRVLIENNLSYFYINNLYASIGYRASYFDEHYLNAITLKLGMETSFMLSVALPFNIEGVVALQLPPNQMNANTFFSIDNIYFGFNLTTAIDVYL